jgi:NAD(P)-dependent dehydrogenase (short-subunit alcohol dehydrogenase family)
MGLHTAIAFAARGDQVVASMRDLDRREALDEAASAADVQLEVVALDVCDAEGSRKTIAEVVDAGPIDVLVNNAGVSALGAVETITDREIELAFETNVLGPLRITRQVIPQMRERRAGSIVNVSSVAGTMAPPFTGVYAATKHALEAWTEALAGELAPFGITVSIVIPGFFQTAIIDRERDRRGAPAASPYSDAEEPVLAFMEGGVTAGEDPRLAAAAVLAASSDDEQLRHVVGSGVSELLVGARSSWDAA